MIAVIISILTSQTVEETVSLTDVAVTSAKGLFPKSNGQNIVGMIWMALGLNNPRRLAHLNEYSLLALCVCSACITAGKRELSCVTVALRCIIALALTGFYSFLDQVHKVFVPGREFDVLDLRVDAVRYIMVFIAIFIISASVMQIMRLKKSKNSMKLMA